MNKKTINVTQPFLPPLNEYYDYLEKIWDNKWLTNNGEFHQKLEEALCLELNVNHISLFSNGTLALLIALKAFEIIEDNAEIITTPYSFVATTHAIKWNNFVPKFVDVKLSDGNIDEKEIEKSITSKTKAILPVHVYGLPANVNAIDKIAQKYNLKVLYDAAHAFGVKHNNESILKFGDLSVLSFHATKVFNTFEGGAIISKSKEMKEKIDDLKNFGFKDETTISTIGINAKMNETQAAMGLLQLKYFDQIKQKRKIIIDFYTNELINTEGVRCLDIDPKITWNYAYFPIFIKNSFHLSRDQLYDKFKANGINVRRYFYPIIPDFTPYIKKEDREKYTNARLLSNQVLCLPIYPELSQDDQIRILSILKK